MPLRITHCCILALHGALVYNVCHHCHHGGYLDDLRGTFRGSASIIETIRACVFWLLVLASACFYLAAGTTDPGFLPRSRDGSEEVADVAPGARLLADEIGIVVTDGQAREVELKTTPGGVSYVYEDDDGILDIELNDSGMESSVGGGVASALGGVAALGAVAAMGAAAAMRGGSQEQPDGETEGEGQEFSAIIDESLPRITPPVDRECTPERSCKVCRVTPPLRTKHCVDCGRCVRTHDHHCPWIANCVGENNRVFFFWFVTLQAFEACWVLIQGGSCLGGEGADFKEAPGILTVGVVFVGLFVTALAPLVVVHIWLAATNLTTWEYLRWRRISYLRSVPAENGSPFSSTLVRNLAMYCCNGSHCLGQVCRMCAAALTTWLPASCANDLDLSHNISPGGGHLASTGEIIWHVGEPHIPCIVENSCYSCFYPSVAS